MSSVRHQAIIKRKRGEREKSREWRSQTPAHTTQDFGQEKQYILKRTETKVFNVQGIFPPLFPNGAKLGFRPKNEKMYHNGRKEIISKQS